MNANGNITVVRVLVVDDDGAIRRLVAEKLRRISGFAFDGGYADAESAWAAMSEKPPELVMMDIRLPGMSGIACTRQIKACWPQARVLMFTGLPDAQVLFDALEAGADGFLYKPFTAAEFPQALRDTWAGNNPLAAEARRLLLEHFRQPAAAASGESLLTARERQIMECLRANQTDKQVAQELGVALRTVHTHLHHIFKKLHTNNRKEAVLRLYGTGRA